MSPRSDRVASVAAVIAAALGLAHAAVSAYWLAGGTVLLDTIGGSIEEWGRERAAPALVALAGITVLKAVVAASALLFAEVGTSVLPSVLFDLARRRFIRLLGWVAAVVLVIYGGVLTAVGLMVEAGVVEAAADANRRALAWHTYLWDPWFFAWGLALLITMRSTARHPRRS